MSENFWLQIITLVLAAISPVLVLWAKGKFEKRLEHVVEQNKTQEAKLMDVGHQLNSRLDEYKKELADKLVAEVAAALAKGRAAGVEEERKRTTGTAKELLEAAEGKAAEVQEVAKTAAAAILSEAEKKK